ncbi:MAG: HDOD domain-containing protein [Syntrophaceae bacterium]
MNTDKIKIIENIPELVSDIPSLPVVASRILHIIADDNSSMEELKKVISLDQSFSSRLLRIANSPYYRRGESLNDVTAAIMRIGFTAIKALVFAASLRDLCQTSRDTDKLLWEHNTAVSIGATVIADQTGLVTSGETLIYGLLHDIGKVLINLRMREKYAEVIHAVQEENIPFHEAEEKILGFDHCDVGEYVTTRWNLPAHLSFVIANHHRKDILETVHDAELRRALMIVRAADFLCSELNIGMSTHGNSLNGEEWKFLKLSSPKKRNKVSERIEEEYPYYKDFVMGVAT